MLDFIYSFSGCGILFCAVMAIITLIAYEE